MSVLATRTLAVKATATVAVVGAGSLWKCWQRWYSSKPTKAAGIVRWNTENKMLFGKKQKAATKLKAAESEPAKGARIDSGSEQDTTTKTTNTKVKAAESEPAKGARIGSASVQDTTPKTTNTKSRKKKTLEAAKISESADFVDCSQRDGASEWWNEEKMSRDEQHKNDIFNVQSAHYNKLLDNGQGYEGSEFSSSRDSGRADGIVIPELLPIPPSKQTLGITGARAASSQDMTGTGAGAKTSHKQKTSKITQDSFSFKVADVVQKFPLAPSEFEVVRSSAEEFHSFVDSLKIRFLPTVNIVLNKTRPDLSNFFLQRWREKMIQELGEEGFRKHQEATIWQGTNLHACIQQYLSGAPLLEIAVPETNRGHWESISSVLRDVTEIQAVETSVTHPWLCYKGTFDCIAKYKNTLYLIDWKTSSKPKPLLGNLYDNPLQVAAYLGAVNMTPDLTRRFGVMEQAAIVVAYANGETAHVHRIQPALCLHYWREWCQRLHQYWTAVAAEKEVTTS